MSYQHSTSGAGYKEAKENLGEKQRAVLDIVNRYSDRICGINDRVIAWHLNWAINRVTPRRNELVAMGYIYEAGKFKDPSTNRLTSYWKVSNKQLNLF